MEKEICDHYRRSNIYLLLFYEGTDYLSFSFLSGGVYCQKNT